MTHPSDVIAAGWYPHIHSSNSRPTKTLASKINNINLWVQTIVKISTQFSLFNSSADTCSRLRKQQLFEGSFLFKNNNWEDIIAIEVIFYRNEKQIVIDFKISTRR